MRQLLLTVPEHEVAVLHRFGAFLAVDVLQQGANHPRVHVVAVRAPRFMRPVRLPLDQLARAEFLDLTNRLPESQSKTE